MAKFINRKQRFTPTRRAIMLQKLSPEYIEGQKISLKENNNTEKKEQDMTTQDKIMQAASILANETSKPQVKKVKKDKGLIERTESSKIILTEDNKELLVD